MRIILAVIFLVLVACNSKEKQTKGHQQENISIEQQLQHEWKNYPDSLLVIGNLAQYYREAGNYTKAIDIVNKSIERNRQQPQLWDMKAWLCLENNDTANAIQAFETAIKIIPEPAYILPLATLYAQTKNPQSLQLADALLISGKANADRESIFIKGLYYSAVGEKQKALAFFDEALKIDYGFMEAYREKASVLASQQKYQEAIAVLSKAVKLNNGYTDGYFYLGKYYEAVKDNAAAIDNYQRALVYANTNNEDATDIQQALIRLGVKP